MAKPVTPEAQAQRMARAVYTKVRSNPQDYLGLSGPVKFDARVFVYVAGFLPNEPLRAQLIEEERWVKAVAQMEFAQQQKADAEAFQLSMIADKARYKIYTKIVNLLGSGAETRDVQDYISKQQRWPCFALAATRKELEREMAVRYAIGSCEVDFHGIELPDGVLVSCRMIPYRWRERRAPARSDCD